MQTAFAQNYEYIQFTTKDGLPTNYVYGVIEDDDGYIWAYTEFGLSKFDGYEFKNYTTKDGLPGNDITLCIKDDKGRIWLYCYKNRMSFLQNDSITIVSEEISGPPSIYNGNCTFNTIHYQSFFYNEKGLNSFLFGLFDKETIQEEPNSFVLEDCYHFSDHLNISHKYALYCSIDNDTICKYSNTQIIGMGNYYDGIIMGVKETNIISWKLAEKRGKVKLDSSPYRSFQFHQLGESNRFLTIPFLEDYILSDHSYIIDVEKEKVKKINWPEKIRASSSYNIDIRDSTYQITTANWLVEYDFTGELKGSYRATKTNEEKGLQRFYKDSKENLWIGSREGLLLIPKKNKKTILLENTQNSSSSIERILPISDDLYCISENGITYQIQNDSLKKIKGEINGNFRSSISTPSGELISLTNKSFLLSTKNNSKVSSKKFEDQFPIITISKQHSDLESTNSLFSFNNAIASTYNNKNKTIYFNPVSQLRKFRLLTESSLELTIDYDIPIPKHLYYHPYEETVFLASIDGLHFEENEKFKPFLLVPELRNIISMYGSKKTLYLGTENQGLFKCNLITKKLTKICDPIRIKQIKETHKGDILLATGEGVVLISGTVNENFKIKKFDINDGLPSNEVNDIHLDHHNNLYVATNDGIAKVDLGYEADYKTQNSDLEIAKFSVNKKEVGAFDSVNFSKEENSIEIEYLLLSYASNSKIKYYTKLEPIQTDWEETESRKVSFLSLSPKDYTFHLKAVDIYGNEINHKPINFKIKKAYWQTNWFSLAILSLACLSIYLIIKGSTKNTKRKSFQKEQLSKRMANLELSALKAQMNPHFVFNALGAIQYFIQVNDVESADNYLTQFARLMRKYLESSKEKLLPLKEEIELLNLYTQLEKLRFEDLFDVKMSVDENVSIEDTYIPTMIIQPFIENAINHGLSERRDKKGILNIKFLMEDEVAVCVVTDNGIGRVKAEKLKWKNHKSRGMEIIAGKIQALKSSGIIDVQISTDDLDSDNSQFPGTKVIFKFKILDHE